MEPHWDPEGQDEGKSMFTVNVQKKYNVKKV